MTDSVYIFDIDSTLANNNHRAHLLVTRCNVCLNKKSRNTSSFCSYCTCDTTTLFDKDSWAEFFDPDLVIQDTPYRNAISFVSKIGSQGIPFYFITGRDESVREVTERWLQLHYKCDVNVHKLVMRKEDEFDLNSVLYKQRAFNTLVKEESLEGKNFAFFEDEDDIITMFNKYGVVYKTPFVWNYISV